MASSTGNLSGGSGQLDMAEVFQLLESPDLSVVEDTVALIQDNLASITDPSLLNGLVDFYIQCGNQYARDLLCMVRQRQHKALMNKIDDYLQKVSTRLKAIKLLNHIICNEPTWTHHIVTSRTFQTVLKCLQVDTDLPTITASLYVVATIMPKMASQLPSYLQTICAIYVRLVSWHTIKPVGASEANLIHLHAAVYALFLCLYGMYPCYFTKYLQEYFQVGSASTKGNLSDKDRARIFENSVSPMLDQVRLNPRLVIDTPNAELSKDRWRKQESQDIIADISKLTLDVTENAEALSSRHESVDDQTNIDSSPSTYCRSDKSQRSGSDTASGGFLDQQDVIWSPSVAIGLSTPPLSRAISPGPSSLALDSLQLSAKFHALQASDHQDGDVTNARRPATLNTAATDSFVPHSPQKDRERKRLEHRSGGQESDSSELVESLQKDASTSKDGHLRGRISSSSLSEGWQEGESTPSLAPSCVENQPPTLLTVDPSITEGFVNITPDDFASASVNQATTSSAFTPGLQPNIESFSTPERELSKQESINESDALISARKLLRLQYQAHCVEKSPNELLDTHARLAAEAYSKYSEKISMVRNKDPEWQLTDVVGSQPASVTMYLRSEVLQMHCALLYERHRREQHALRARKLMRKVYDTSILEEKNNVLTMQFQTKVNEVDGYLAAEKRRQKRLKEQEESYNAEVKRLKSELQEARTTNRSLTDKKNFLEKENISLKEQCEDMKTETARVKSKLFSIEHLFQFSQADKAQILKMESQIGELQSRLFETLEANSILEGNLREARGDSQAKSFEAQLRIDAYARELDALRTTHRKEQCELDITKRRLEQAQENIQRRENLMTEQKKYLENVKSLARGQINALEAKYSAQKNVVQRLERQVLELFSKLTAIEGEMALSGRSHLTSAARPIEAVSYLHTDSQKILGSSPQLSPPIPGGLLAEGAQWLPKNKPSASGHMTTSFSDVKPEDI